MKRVLVILVSLGLGVTCAVADSSQLGGGVLIVHQVAGLVYSIGLRPNEWCQAYLEHPIQGCEGQNNTLEVATIAPAVWFVLAAWLEDKQWCGVEFGLGSYDPRLFGIAEQGPCFPESGIEIPTDHWPGPNQGTSIVTTGAPWSGSFLPIYYFAGYAYASFGPGVIPLGANPATGFAGTANCLVPADTWPALALGGLGINTDGIYVCPTAVCCDSATGGCVLATEAECRGLGGHWMPDLFSCAGAPCLIRACCCGDNCFLMTESDCHDIGCDWFQAFESCERTPCPAWPLAVCCFGSECRIMNQFMCEAFGGQWHPEWQSCERNPCGPTPSPGTTWGAIKAMFRR